MATLDQVKKLDIIRDERLIAKKNRLNIAAQLSGGQRKYKAAINIMISVGALASVLAVIGAVIYSYELWALLVQNQQLPDNTWTVVALGYLTFIVEFILGIKLYKTDVTPIFALVSLIVIILSNIFLVGGLLAWITAGLAVAGLICWGTFKNWFNDIDTNCNKKMKRKK